MGKAGLVEKLSLGREAKPEIKIDGGLLSGQMNRVVAALAGAFAQGGHHGRADALAAKLGQYRHPADVRIRQQSAGAQVLCAAASQHMHALRIAAVDFDRLGDMLLLDKDPLANPQAALRVIRPIDDLNL